ncbi:MAG: C39 family peptidase [Myxococcota bacterium]
MTGTFALAPLVAASLAWGLAAGAARAQPAPDDPNSVAALAPASPATSIDDRDTAPSGPRIYPVLRPDEPLIQMQLDLAIPVVRQSGDKTNCGPTTAAMTLAAFKGEDSPKRARELRDLVGEWSWQAFPLRQMRIPGYDAGMTTREMMRQSLDAFGAPADVRFEVVGHPWLPLEAWSILALKRHLAEHRPLVVLVEAKTLWNLPKATGLHWVVVRGFADGQVVFNDPADGAVASVTLERFWNAWHLSEAYRSLPMVDGFEGLVADRSLATPPVPLPTTRPDARRPLR